MAKAVWRIQVRDGKVVDCREVELAATDTDDVFYVLAKDRAEAGRKAWNAYTSRLNKRRRAAYIAEGRCGWCGRANDRAAHLKCTVCLNVHAEAARRRRARDRGEEVPPPDRAVSIAARAHEQRQAIRAAVLLEVQQAWQDAPNNAAFTRWLGRQIEACIGRRVA